VVGFNQLMGSQPNRDILHFFHASNHGLKDDLIATIRKFIQGIGTQTIHQIFLCLKFTVNLNNGIY